VSLRSEVRVVVFVTISAYKRCSIPPVVCRRAHVLVTLLCLLAHSGVQHILSFVFVLFILDLYLVDLTTVLPVLFKYCCKYCYSDSRKL
jgi:hypothetical protein